ncbi:hypothetical protein BGW36DRAFT_293961 [Talaromyces proteolyticus]|uniref:Uncharacterized protein n=1 Tax=Talaromyces proteolyticus TaxID=1131652 RepID=A0AAD4KR85_9EURO|nr:uncharacterized protein BGW36DRAFT_293961 [Talaromyces proteolyticus]KAH8698645.1 hypothetical protein BGW36DRAFT_293961 [Talaromyces proteolyticus]
MVIGLLAVTAIPTVTGVSLGVVEQRKQNTRMEDEKRMAKFHIDVFCEGNSEKAMRLNRRRGVLRDNKVYIDHADPSLRKQTAHTAAAFYIGYPDDNQKRGDGLVSTISDNPPMLNWIYVDKNTMELKYGNRTQSIEHIVGHWDWTEDEAGVILDKKELWVAVEEEDDVWALYYDQNSDGLTGFVDPEKTVVEISICRNLIDKPEGGNNSDQNQT